MSGIKGNYIKTALYLGDMREEFDPALSRFDTMTVQNYNYTISKGRNRNGDPHGGAKPSALTFTIRSPKSEQSRRIYRLLRDGEEMTLSMLFNPHYNLNGELDGYHAATVVRGAVVLASEAYDSQPSSSSEARIMLKFKVMIHRITYLANDREHTMSFK